ncbi:hypothetical protein L1278_000335 [Pontibacter sp. HSC-36F09]|nr:hypothetical protein [Pontibacter sp. HSC-36F09]
MPVSKLLHVQGMITLPLLFCCRAVFGLGSRPILRNFNIPEKAPGIGSLYLRVIKNSSFVITNSR